MEVGRDVGVELEAVLFQLRDVPVGLVHHVEDGGLLLTKCCQGNYEGDGNGIFYVFIQVTDDQYLSGETNF